MKNRGAYRFVNFPCKITTTLPPGARAITTLYSGNATYNSSNFIQTVLPSSLEAIIYFLLS